MDLVNYQLLIAPLVQIVSRVFSGFLVLFSIAHCNHSSDSGREEPEKNVRTSTHVRTYVCICIMTGIEH